MLDQVMGDGKGPGDPEATVRDIETRSGDPDLETSGQYQIAPAPKSVVWHKN